MKKYFIFAAVVAMFAACTNDDITQQSPTENERIPLTVGYSMGSMTPKGITRGNITDIQDKELVNSNNNTKIGLFLFKKGGVSVVDNSYEKFNITSTAMDNTIMAAANLSVMSYTDLNYPDNKTQHVDMYAYAPHISNSADATISNVPASFTDISTQYITFFTETDQTSEANYVKSDVLWGCAGTGNNIANAIAANGSYQKLNYTALGNNNEVSALKYLEVRREWSHLREN